MPYTNRETKLLYLKEYRKRNPEKFRGYAKKWSDAHLEKVRAGRLRRKAEVLKHYSPSGLVVCATCGFDNLVALTLSHVGKVPEEFKSERGKSLYVRLRAAGYPKIALLCECLNCNVLRDNWGNGYGHEVQLDAQRSSKPRG